MMDTKIPLILFPGLGADRRIFLSQIEQFDAIVPPWIEPVKGESMEDYGRRYAQSLEFDGPCYVGGLSFGGMLAPIVASHLGARACILMSTIRCGAELPWYYVLLCGFLSRLSILLWPLVFIAQFLARWCARLFGWLVGAHRASLFRQFADTPTKWIVWAVGALYRWNRLSTEPADYPFPIYHIHGTKDCVLPVRRTTPDVLIEGAGHVSSATHSDEVNRFIQICIAKTEGGKIWD